MLTGRRLFEGETVSDTLAAVLRAEPDWSEIPAETPARLRRVLRRCLVRNPATRLRDIGDAVVEHHDVTAGEGETARIAPAPGASTSSWRHVPWVVAFIAVAIAAALAVSQKSGDASLPLRKLTIVPITDPGQLSSAVLSPDGKRVAYVAGDALWVRELDQATPRRLADARGFGSRLCFWSPDSHWLAFVNDDKLWKAPVDGSAPTLICEIPTARRSLAGAWGPHDRIILGQWRGGLLEVSPGGGTLRELMHAPRDLVDYHSLSFLPDGKSLIGAAHLVGNSSRIDVLRDGRIVRKVVLADGYCFDACYSQTGHIVFQREPNRGVWAVPFSLENLATTGEPFVIDPDGSHPSVALDGSLVYSRNVERAPSQLVKVDMSGKVIGTLGEPAEDIRNPLFSPSGALLTYAVREKEDVNAWILDPASGVTRRITQFKGDTWASSWSRDGRQLLVSRRIPDNWSSPETGTYLVNVAGDGEANRLTDGVVGQLLPDGSGVLYWKFGLRNDDRLAWTTFAKGASPQPFVASMHRATSPVISPDGHLVAFESDDSGTSEVWVARFPSGDGREQLSRGGGRDAVWSRDGRSIYYDFRGSIYRIPVSESTPASFGAPGLLFDGNNSQLVARAGFAVLPDGSGFVLVKRLPLDDAGIIHVQNWFAEFK
jgi:serine/threonine-protein kinase